MLTPSQRHALRTDTHLSVTANAGSGKTRVLVDRYLGLVTRGDVSVANVVAITFTEKAASELRKKVAEGVQDLLVSDPAPAIRRQLETVREDLPSAVIHTIHGFCSRLLREFPVEAGVDAAFGIIEPVDRAVLVDEALQGVLRSILRDGEPPELRDALAGVVRGFGKRTVTGTLAGMAGRREILERMTEPGGVLTLPDDVLLGRWRDAVTARLETAFERADSELWRLLENARGEKAEAARGAYRRVHARGNAGDRLRGQVDLLRLLLTAGGTVVVAIAGRGDRAHPDRPHVEMHLGPLRALADLLPDRDLEEDHTTLLHAVRTLGRVHHLAMDRFEAAKRERAVLDYEDLQLRARTLLTKEHVRTRLAARYRFIMVDEYQDTNRLQYEILRPLVDDLRSGNLFIVGDPKQSIYGFRNAEVEVFLKTREDIVGAAGPGASVTLGESFRPLRSVAAAVNTLFSSAMSGTDAAPAGVAYDPLVQARDEEHPGRVEMLVQGGTADEGTMVARRIRRLVREGIDDGTGDRTRAVRYGDVAVLVRTRRLLPGIEEALVREEIPYLVSGGTGYFQTQDVFDFANYLQFILTPADDLALAGILRSPFFAVSDAELFEAAGPRHAGSLWERLSGTAGRGAAAPALTRAIAILEADLACGHRLPVPDLLDRIVAQTGYEAVVGSLPRGEQSLANLRKLEEFIRRADARGFTSLHDIVRRLRRLMDEEEKEGQGVIDITRDAVQVMTVHAAKGLEFPVVILPGLERRFLYDRELFLDEELGMAFRPGIAQGKGAPVEWILAEQAAQRLEAEEKRIFYVACTRARDMLVLSGDEARAGSGPTWLKWLLEAFGWKGIPGGDHADLRVPLDVYRTHAGEGSVRSEDFHLRVHFVRQADRTAGEPAGEVDREPEGLRIAVGEIPRGPRSEIYTATQLRTYEECPARYYLRYVLGVEEPGGEGEPDEEPRPVRMLAANVRGSIMHALLQRIDGLDESAVLPLARELVLAQGGAGTEAEREAEALARSAAGVRTSPFWHEVVAGTETRKEYTITASLGSDFVTGTLDRIYRDAGGIRTVLDFKSEALAAGELEERARAYRTQMEFYLLLAHRLFGGDRLRAVVLFTRYPGTPVRMEVGEADLLRIEERLLGLIQRINSFDFKPLDGPCPPCRWLLPQCPVR